jgi:lipopolysaccharide exporter
MSGADAPPPGEDAPDLRAAAERGVRWAAMSRPAIEIVLLASMVVIARLISPAEYGRFAVVTALAELAIAIPSQGVGTALVQMATVERRHERTGALLGIAISVALVILAFVLSWLVIGPIFGERTAHLVQLATPGFLLVGIAAVPMAMLTRRLAFKWLSLIDVGNTMTRAAASVALALAGLDAEALIYGGLLAGALATLMACIKAPPALPGYDREAAREILKLGVPAAGAGLSWVGFRNCDYAIVGARLGAVQAGLYFRAYTLAVEYQKKVSLVVGQVGFPVLARARSAEARDQMRGQMVQVLTVVLFPLLSILAITAPVLVPFVFGPEWAPAAVPTQVLALGGASTLVIDAVGASLLAERRTHAVLVFGWAHFAVYATAVLLIAPLGLTAVALAAAVVHTGFMAVSYAMMLRGSDEGLIACMTDDLAPAVVSCLALAAAALPVDLALAAGGVGEAGRLVLVSATGAIGYTVALRVCFPRTWDTVLGFAGGVLPANRMPRLRRGLVLLTRTSEG